MIKMPLGEEFELIKQGAEAKLYRGTYLGRPTIVKERFRKSYRIPELDDSLTKERIKAESRAIIRCKQAGIYAPALYLVDLERRCIFMEEILESVTVKDYIMKLSENKVKEFGDEESKSLLTPLAQNIGRVLGKLHSNNIIHGDLTTSNMLLVESESQKPRLYLIDFGLSQCVLSAEDKGVDLYVLERALLSTHAHVEHLFQTILVSYAKEYKNGSSEVLKKLDDVRARGRKRTMVG